MSLELQLDKYKPYPLSFKIGTLENNEKWEYSHGVDKGGS